MNRHEQTGREEMVQASLHKLQIICPPYLIITFNFIR